MERIIYINIHLKKKENLYPDLRKTVQSYYGVQPIGVDEMRKTKFDYDCNRSSLYRKIMPYLFTEYQKKSFQLSIKRIVEIFNFININRIDVGRADEFTLLIENECSHIIAYSEHLMFTKRLHSSLESGQCKEIKNRYVEIKDNLKNLVDGCAKCNCTMRYGTSGNESPQYSLIVKTCMSILTKMHKHYKRLVASIRNYTLYTNLEVTLPPITLNSQNQSME
ncbi:MAG: hypothetical protein RL613_1116 [Fusobacteriota bacterium]|jgi:hypothetical protein